MIKENTMLIKKKRKIYDKYLRRFSCSNKWYVMTIILLLIIILSFQIIILNIGFDKSKKTNNKKIKERLFLFKEDKNNSKDTNKFKIHIVMSIDNNGIYISLVSMTSALENNNKEKNIFLELIIIIFQIFLINIRNGDIQVQFILNY